MAKLIEYIQADTFQKSLKKLRKRFGTLVQDLEVAKRSAIELFHLKNIDNRSIVLMTGYQHDELQVYKLRKFACQSLKGRGNRSGIRVVYAYHICERKVVFLDVYFKADRESENSEAIKDFLRNY